MIKNEINIDELLENNYKSPISSFDGKYTKTSLFLLNTIEVNLYKPLVKKFFINAFIDDYDYNHRFIRPIFCLFKTKDFRDKEWKQLYNLCIQKEEFITDYDCGIQEEEHLIMIVFKCPDIFSKDYYLFKTGNYSKFSENLKSKYPETIISDSGNKVKSLVYGVVYKKDYVKNKIQEILEIDDKMVEEMEEFWSIPKVERETYRFKNKENEENISLW